MKPIPLKLEIKAPFGKMAGKPALPKAPNKTAMLAKVLGCG